MIDYGCFYFAAPKLCSAQWFTDMMGAVGFQPNGNPEFVFTTESTDKLRVSLVENPVQWLNHCYNTIGSGLLYDLPPFTDLPNQSREGFLRAYLHECPGAVGELFGHYKADSIMRVEDLPWALVDLLTTLGIEKAGIESVRRVVPGGSFVNRTIDRTLRNRILDAERSLCEQYDFI